MSDGGKLEDALRFYTDRSQDHARPKPFKFLDPYEVPDRKIFFGRDAEIEDVLVRYYRSQVFVVYGESGSGKTSLIQCGLDAAIPTEDAEFFFIRSSEDPLVEIRGRLSGDDGDPEESIVSIVRGRSEASFKTVVLVFDQFEELFILKKHADREHFFQQLAEALGARLDLKVIFIVREEYFARMTEAEQHIPLILENRYWLRKMGTHEATEVIEGPCREFGIELESGLSRGMLDRLVDSRGEIDLPYLQIMLDRAYHHALKRGEPIRLLLSDLAEMGEMSDILSDFLEGRVATLEDPFFGRDVLKQFVTGMGTKKPARLDDVLEGIRDSWPERKKDAVRRLLLELVEARILRQDEVEAVFELRHDALAVAVSRWLSPFEEELLEIRGYFDDRLAEWRQNGTLIDDLQTLKRVERLLPHLHHTDGAYDLLHESREAIRSAKMRRSLFTIVMPVVFAVLLVAAYFWAWSNSQSALYAELESSERAVEVAMLQREIDAISSYSQMDWNSGDRTYSLLRASKPNMKDQTDLVFAQASWLLAFGNGAGCVRFLQNFRSMFAADHRYDRALGLCQLVAGDTESAVSRLETAAADSEDPCAFLDLGLAYAMNGNISDAWTVYSGTGADADNTCAWVSLQRLLHLRAGGTSSSAVPLYEAFLWSHLGNREKSADCLSRFLSDVDASISERWYSFARKRLDEITTVDGGVPESGESAGGHLPADSSSGEDSKIK